MEPLAFGAFVLPDRWHQDIIHREDHIGKMSSVQAQKGIMSMPVKGMAETDMGKSIPKLPQISLWLGSMEQRRNWNVEPDWNLYDILGVELNCV